jgi:hypothetical protein
MQHLLEPLLEEVHPDGLLVLVGEDAAAILLDHGGLAHSAVTHDHYLKERRGPSYRHTAHPAG